jgi:RNA polymerase sigma-70 factor, ECF subfamily
LRTTNNPDPDSKLKSEIDSLIDRAMNGDAEAFGHLYDIYADRIYHHVFYRTNNMEDARDLTQEVFVKAWQAMSRYKHTKTPFLGWLFTISHNRVIDYYRTKKDHAYLDNEMCIPDSQGNNPELLAEAHFTQQEVRRTILQLPEDQQQVILMSFIEGFEYNEIAAALNKGEGNIRVIVHRALKKMRSLLDQEEGIK